MRIRLHAPLALARRTAAVTAAAALVAVAACDAKSGRDDYARDGDTGAAAPATVLTPTNEAAPDSTAGISQRTGTPGSAGDRQGQNGTAAIPNTPAAGQEAARATKDSVRKPNP